MNPSRTTSLTDSANSNAQAESSKKEHACVTPLTEPDVKVEDQQDGRERITETTEKTHVEARNAGDGSSAEAEIMLECQDEHESHMPGAFIE